MSENRLHLATSPYLLQHKDNPVHWQIWGDDAFERAKAENKPVLLSVGYAACHWCHVMAHESFEDPEVAELMNRHFISIKVDREERPDVDGLYQNALGALGEQGGWPLTMFLTPGGVPFGGGTYFPPVANYGRPAFKTVLTRVHETYRDQPETILENQTAIMKRLAKVMARPVSKDITPAILDQISASLLGNADPQFGGLGQAQKFPQCGVYQGFWRCWQRTGNVKFRNAVTLMVRHMSMGGIYDHLGGGFARYTVEPSWLVPHFEKMLYDQAQIIMLFTEVWRDTGEALLKRRISETLAWLDRDMRISDAGSDAHAFAASLDADSEGVEGAYYVWSEAEIDAALTNQKERQAFKRAYDVSSSGNWEGSNILHLDPQAEVSETDSLAAARANLLAIRSDRVPPDQDDKILCDWNASLVVARAEAGMAFGRADWIEAAAANYQFLLQNHGAHGQLQHSFRNGSSGAIGMLEDYAGMAEAALTLYEATGRDAYLDQARRWVGDADNHFWDDENGGYFQTSDQGDKLILRPRSAHDSATPAGNGTMLKVLARLFHLSGEKDFQTHAEQLIKSFSGEVSLNVYPLATFLEGVELYNDPTEVVLVGDRSHESARRMLDIIWAAPLKGRILSVIAPGTTLPPGHPAEDKLGTEALATDDAIVYICQGKTCSLPIKNEAELRAQLEEMRNSHAAH